MQWLMFALTLGALSRSPADNVHSNEPPRRVRSVALTPGEKCPSAPEGEVVVCAPIEEPYRIPKMLRRSEIANATQSWVNRAAAIDEVGRVAAGLPDTCSVVGTGGQTGCTQAMMRAWAAERRQMKADAAVP